jgi:prepilin signal peptidase PulO-like enzyme (type II secretory pathway)
MMTGGGIGGGDIKLVGLLGILYGASGLLAVLLASCLFALLHYTICRLFQHKKMERIPFAPYLFLGCIFYMLLQLLTLS